jgi:hypothetical protein
VRITEKLLKAIGCEKVDRREAWRLSSGGYLFFWQREPESEHTWAFHVCMETFEMGWNYGHSVTDIEECFGMIAKDHFEYGKDERSEEIRELLGITNAHT